MKIGKLTLIIFFLAYAAANAQKVTIGDCITKDGAAYHGEMLGNKPHGKGVAKFSNGDVYKGEYVKGKRQGKGGGVSIDLRG